MKSVRRVGRKSAWLSLAAQFTACAPAISPFSSLAFQQATSLKVEALGVMSHATEAFSNHREEVAVLVTNIEKAYEFARNRPQNDYSTKQWEKIKNPNANLLGGFLKRWEEQSALSRTFVDEAKGLVRDAFNEIIGLESGKGKPGQ